MRGAQKGGRELGLEAFGGMAFSRDSNSLSSLPGLSGFAKDELTSSSILGGAGALLPLGRRAALGLAVYTPLLQGADFQDVAANGTGLDYRSRAGILVSNVSASAELLPALALGAGANVLYGTISTETTLTNHPTLGRSVSDLSGDGVAVEGIFGLRWDPHPRWSAGLVYRTGADVPIRGRATASSSATGSEATDFRYSLRHPPTSDLGVAFRPGEAWTFTADLHHTYWERFTNEIRYDRPGTLLQNSAGTFRWRNTWKLRLGARRRLGERWELLGGYSLDRPAVDASSVDFATAVDVRMHRFSGGVTRRWGPRLETTLGAVGGFGSRTEGAVRYRLSGFQLMAGARLAL